MRFIAALFLAAAAFPATPSGAPGDAVKSLAAARTDADVLRALRDAGLLESLADAEIEKERTPRDGMDASTFDENLFGTADPERVVLVRFDGGINILAVYRRQGGRWTKIPGVLWTASGSPASRRCESLKCPGGFCVSASNVRRPDEAVLVVEASGSSCAGERFFSATELTVWQVTAAGFYGLHAEWLERFAWNPRRGSVSALDEHAYRFADRLSGGYPRQLVVTGPRRDIEPLRPGLAALKGLEHGAARAKAREAIPGSALETVYSLPFAVESEGGGHR